MNQEQLVKIFKALANESRLRILEAIKCAQVKCKCCPESIALFEGKGPTLCCVEEIVDKFDMAQSTISQQLKELHNAGLLKRNKKAQWVYYTVDEKLLEELADYLHGVAHELVVEG
jgi:DNA-binding transcriptional ArsR family regulator